MGPAGFWPRYAAWSLDAALVGTPVLALTSLRGPAALDGVVVAFNDLAAQLAARAIDAMRSTQDPWLLAQAWLVDPALPAASARLQAALWQWLQPPIVAFLVLGAVYWIAFEGSPWRATPGKRALGLVVSGVDRQPLGLARAAVRHAAGALSWLTLNAGHALAALPPQKRALHDYIAGARVLGPGRIPGWARAWLVLQAVAAIIAAAWLLRLWSASLQAAVANAW